MALTSSIGLAVSANQTRVLDLATGLFPLADNYNMATTDGTTAGKADLLFTDTRTLGAGATEDLDLAGVLTDAFGVVLTYVRVKGMIISAAVANTNNVVVGGAAATQFASWVGDPTDKVVIRPGGTFALFCDNTDATGYVTTGGATDFLRIGNSGGGTGVDYSIIVIGCSA